MAVITVAASSTATGVVQKASSFYHPNAPDLLAVYQYGTTPKRRTSCTKSSSLSMASTNSPVALKCSLSRDTQLLCGEGNHHISRRSRSRSRSHVIASASMDYRVCYPDKVKSKPEWWWRTLSSAPYLMALQVSDAAFYFQPLIERYEHFQFLSYYIPGAIKRLPSWFLMAYCFGVYMGIVRNRQQWPHFFRYHVMMGLLLENLLQILWYASNFMPLIHYKGTFAMPYWPIVATLFISSLLYCVTCALRGLYVNFPFVSEAAYVHTPYVRGDH